MNISTVLTRFLPAVMVLCLIAPATTARAQDAEPPQAFQLKVGNQTYDIAANQEIEIDASGKVKVKLTASPTRNFAYGGLNFLYPNNYAWQCEHGEGSYQWLMDGNDVVVMVFGFDEVELGHREFAKSIATNYEDYDIKKCTKLVGKDRRSGSEIQATVNGQVICQQVFEIPTDDGSRLLIIQDSLDEDGKHTDEYSALVKLLGKSFRATSERLK